MGVKGDNRELLLHYETLSRNRSIWIAVESNASNGPTIGSISDSSPSERPKASNSSASDASNYAFDFDPQTSLGDDQLKQFDDVCSRFEHLMATSGRALPPQWSLPELTREVIGEEAVSLSEGCPLRSFSAWFAELVLTSFLSIFVTTDERV